MVRYTTGDILAEDAEALVNTVNCVGAMGRGIALQFKNAFPRNYRAYAIACRRGEVQPGSMFVFETGMLANPRLIVNFPTKRHWRSASRMEDIDSGLVALKAVIREWRVGSIAVPPLGSGLGGLDWFEVRPRIHEALSGLDTLQAVVFKPYPESAPKPVRRRPSVPRMTEGRAALVALMDRYVYALLAPYVTLLEVHKLLYFMQEAGQSLKLRYVKGYYGPYAENLRHVLSAIDGHLVSGWQSDGDSPDRPLEVMPGVVDLASAVLQGSRATRERFDRVMDLVEGFESPFGLELLATVHWVSEHDKPGSRDQLIRSVHAWNDRKKRFWPSQIRRAADILEAKGWSADSAQN